MNVFRQEWPTQGGEIPRLTNLSVRNLTKFVCIVQNTLATLHIRGCAAVLDIPLKDMIEVVIIDKRPGDTVIVVFHLNVAGLLLAICPAFGRATAACI